MKREFYRDFVAYSSFNASKLLERLYPLHFSVFNKFLEEVLIIPFNSSSPKELKEEFPEGDIILCSSKESRHKLKNRIVIIFRKRKE